MQYKNASCFIIVIIVMVLVLACAPTEFFPDEGKWYCEELEMQLAFGNDDDCFVIRNGRKMKCACGSDRGSNYLSVGCQEFGCEYCYLGEEIFGATFVSLDETMLVVKDVNNGKEYVFTRIG